MCVVEVTSGPRSRAWGRKCARSARGSGTSARADLAMPQDCFFWPEAYAQQHGLLIGLRDFAIQRFFIVHVASPPSIPVRRAGTTRAGLAPARGLQHIQGWVKRAAAG